MRIAQQIRTSYFAQASAILVVAGACTMAACSPPPAARIQPAPTPGEANRSPDATAAPRVGFPVLPPLSNADPTSRHARNIAVPTRLNVERSDSRIAVEVDRKSLRTESMLVGENMIVGYSWSTDVLSEGATRRAGGGGWSGAPGTGVNYYNTKTDGLPIPGERYTIEMRFTIFETDIPAQHMWSPESGRFKVLLTRTIRAHVDP